MPKRPIDIICKTCGHYWLFHMTVTDLRRRTRCNILNCRCPEFFNNDVTVQT